MAGVTPPRDAALAPRVVVLIPFVLALLSMIGPFSIDTPFPAFDRMGEDLGVPTHELQLVVSAYLLPFAVMSIFHGPLSDAVGRRPVLVGGMAVYAVASVACAFAPSLGWLLAGRVAQGLAAGAATIVSRTVIRDLYEGPVAQRLRNLRLQQSLDGRRVPFVRRPRRTEPVFDRLRITAELGEIPAVFLQSSLIRQSLSID